MTFLEAVLKDPLIHQMVTTHRGTAEIIAALATRHAAIIEELILLKAIAPKKCRLPDGTLRIFRCPEDLIPLTELPPDSSRTT